MSLTGTRRLSALQGLCQLCEVVLPCRRGIRHSCGCPQMFRERDETSPSHVLASCIRRWRVSRRLAHRMGTSDDRSNALAGRVARAQSLGHGAMGPTQEARPAQPMEPLLHRPGGNDATRRWLAEFQTFARTWRSMPARLSRPRRASSLRSIRRGEHVDSDEKANSAPHKKSPLGCSISGVSRVTPHRVSAPT
jgi:hypothetical protein